jgi:ankyrin repeat protein
MNTACIAYCVILEVLMVVSVPLFAGDNQETLLHIFAKHRLMKDVASMQILINANPELLKAKDRFGNIPLMTAIRSLQFEYLCGDYTTREIRNEKIQFLLSKGSSLEEKNKEGQSASAFMKQPYITEKTRLKALV